MLLNNVHHMYTLAKGLNIRHDPSLPIVPMNILEHALDVVQAILLYPNKSSYNIIITVAMAQYCWRSPQIALNTYRSALRMYALLYGREKRFVMGDKHTAELIQKLPETEVAITYITVHSVLRNLQRWRSDSVSVGHASR